MPSWPVPSDGVVTSETVMMTVSVSQFPAASVTFNVTVYVPGVAKV